MSRHLPARLVAAAVLAAATGVGLLAGSAPATAATCPTSEGVSLVVDFGALGGGVETSCDGAGASRNAAAIVSSAGHALTYVQRFPGFICRIDGVPAADPCVNTPPADAYWGVFWSDGKSGEWVYASTAAGSLRVPAGGYVGVAWQSGGRRVPGVPASVHAAPPPTTKPSPQPSKSPTPTRIPSTAPTRSPTPSTADSPSPTQVPSPTPTPKKSPTPSPSPGVSDSPSSLAPSPTASSPSESSSESPSEFQSEAPAVTDDDSPAASAVPTWLVLAVLALLLVGGAVAVVVRRRRS